MFEYQDHWVKVKVVCKKLLFTYFNLLFLCVWLQVINKVNVTHQGQGQIKVIFRERMLLCGWFTFESNAFLFVGLEPLLERRSYCPLYTPK